MKKKRKSQPAPFSPPVWRQDLYRRFRAYTVARQEFLSALASNPDEYDALRELFSGEHRRVGTVPPVLIRRSE